jgi:hypothetical protein
MVPQYAPNHLKLERRVVNVLSGSFFGVFCTCERLGSTSCKIGPISSHMVHHRCGNTPKPKTTNVCLCGTAGPHIQNGKALTEVDEAETIRIIFLDLGAQKAAFAEQNPDLGQMHRGHIFHDSTCQGKSKTLSCMVKDYQTLASSSLL